MPRIPLYEPDQISANQLQTPRANPMPVSSGIGKGLLDIAVVANKMQDEADTLRAEEAYNNWIKTRDELAYNKDNGAFTIKGANVLNRPADSSGQQQTFVGEFTGKAQSAANDIAAGLANDNQRAKFGRLAGTAIRSFGTTLSQYEAKEAESWRKSVYEGVVNTEIDNVATNFENPELRQQSIDRVRDNTRTFASSQGLSGEQLDATVKDAVSKVHGTVISRMLENNQSTAAKEYYEANKDAITAKDGAQLRKAIKSDQDNVQAQDAVDAVWKGFGPQEDDEAVNLDAMAATIRDQYKDNPTVQKMALAMLKERASEFDYSVRQRESQQMGGIWKRVIAGEGMAAITKTPEWRSLDGAKQASMMSSIQSFQNGQGENNLDKYADYWAYKSNPQKLAAMSDAEIFALAPKLGTTLTKQLLKDKVDLGKSEAKVFDVTVDNDMLKTIATYGGIDIDSNDGKKLLGELEYRSKLLIEAEQQNRGRKLLMEEKQKIVKQLFMEVPVRVKNRWYEPGETSVENRPLYSVKNPDSIVVPDDVRTAIVNVFKNAGIPNPTEKQIRDGYLRLKAQ